MRYLLVVLFLLTLAPTAWAQQVTRSSYCQVVTPDDWATASGHWVVHNDTGAPITLTLNGIPIQVLVPGPDTGDQKRLVAQVRTGKIEGNTPVFEPMSFIPAGAFCYGIFDPQQFIPTAKSKARISMRVRLLHVASSVGLIEQETRVFNPSDLWYTDSTYVPPIKAMQGVDRYAIEIQSSDFR